MKKEKMGNQNTSQTYTMKYKIGPTHFYWGNRDNCAPYAIQDGQLVSWLRFNSCIYQI